MTIRDTSPSPFHGDDAHDDMTPATEDEDRQDREDRDGTEADKGDGIADVDGSGAAPGQQVDGTAQPT